MKSQIESRWHNYKQKFKGMQFGPRKGMAEEDIKSLLKEFLEHPTKPGYKRQDIEYFLKLMEND